jgi:hypothetical protein
VKFGQVPDLLLQQTFHGSLGDSLGGFRHDGCHHGQINIQARPVFSEGPFADNFSELFGEFADLGEIL